jgi:hypothetical protein
MKKIPAYVLLAVLLINAAGFYIYYIIELQRIHIAMRERLRFLPDDQLTRLPMTHEAYKRAFVEEGEIKYEGRMFDIGRIQMTSDSVIVFALHDENEDNLLTFINEIISKPFNADSDVASFVMGSVLLLYLPGTGHNLTVDKGKPLIHLSQYLIHPYRSVSQKHFQPPRTLFMTRHI